MSYLQWIFLNFRWRPVSPLRRSKSTRVLWLGKNFRFRLRFLLNFPSFTRFPSCFLLHVTLIHLLVSCQTTSKTSNTNNGCWARFILLIVSTRLDSHSHFRFPNPSSAIQHHFHVRAIVHHYALGLIFVFPAVLCLISRLTQNNVDHSNFDCDLMNIFQPVCLVTDHLADVMAAENWYRRAREAAAAPPPPVWLCTAPPQSTGQVGPLGWSLWPYHKCRSYRWSSLPVWAPKFCRALSERLRVNEKMNLRFEKEVQWYPTRSTLIASSFLRSALMDVLTRKETVVSCCGRHAVLWQRSALMIKAK